MLWSSKEWDFKSLTSFHSFLLFPSRGNGVFQWICSEISREKYCNKSPRNLLNNTLKTVLGEQCRRDTQMEIHGSEAIVWEWENTGLLIDKISSSISDRKRGRTRSTVVPYQKRIVTSSQTLSIRKFPTACRNFCKGNRRHDGEDRLPD